MIRCSCVLCFGTNICICIDMQNYFVVFQEKSIGSGYIVASPPVRVWWWVVCFGVMCLGRGISFVDMYMAMAVGSMMSSCCPGMAPSVPSVFVSRYSISSTHRRSRSMYSPSRMAARVQS